MVVRRGLFALCAAFGVARGDDAPDCADGESPFLILFRGYAIGWKVSLSTSSQVVYETAVAEEGYMFDRHPLCLADGCYEIATGPGDQEGGWGTQEDTCYIGWSFGEFWAGARPVDAEWWTAIKGDGSSVEGCEELRAGER